MSDSPVPKPPVVSFPDTLGAFRTFCQKVLPAVYDDSLSYYELLCKVVDYLNETMGSVDELNSGLKQVYDYLKQLQQTFEDYIDGKFDDYYGDVVRQWIESHLDWIFTNVVRQVYFGLNLEGYFVAYIPSGWSDIVFDTGADYSLDTYGRLILRWDADSPYNVDQTPEKARQ